MKDMKKKKLYGTYFYGNEASEYAKEQGYLDYATLAKAFDAVMSNDIVSNTNNIIGYWEQENGLIDNSEEIEELEEKISDLEYEQPSILVDSEKYLEIQNKIDELQERINELKNETEPEIFQYFIISEQGANILKEWTDEIVYYNETLDMYVWGVTHWGDGMEYGFNKYSIKLWRRSSQLITHSIHYHKAQARFVCVFYSA